MKAILIIDLPDGTNLEKLSVDYQINKPLDEHLIYEYLRGFDCGLKPLPEKKEIKKECCFDGYENGIQMGLARGYNACIDEILKGE